jgi:hypothetical protein
MALICNTRSTPRSLHPSMPWTSTSGGTHHTPLISPLVCSACLHSPFLIIVLRLTTRQPYCILPARLTLPASPRDAVIGTDAEVAEIIAQIREQQEKAKEEGKEGPPPPAPKALRARVRVVWCYVVLCSVVWCYVFCGVMWCSVA